MFFDYILCLCHVTQVMSHHRTGYFHVWEKFGKVKKDLTLPSPVINFSMALQNDCEKKHDPPR